VTFIPHRIIVHCSASPNGKDIPVEEVRRWHLERGFEDIGYHYLIGVDGAVHEGRSILRMGAHCKGENSNSIGICLIGDTKFTVAQFGALRTLLLGLCWQKKIPQVEVHCHYEFPSAIKEGKTCPNIPVQKIIHFMGTADLDIFDKERLD
jgi:N-acetylmuramoyl-L-alanine amidase.